MSLRKLFNGHSRTAGNRLGTRRQAQQHTNQWKQNPPHQSAAALTVIVATTLKEMAHGDPEIGTVQMCASPTFFVFRPQGREPCTRCGLYHRCEPGWLRALRFRDNSAFGLIHVLPLRFEVSPQRLLFDLPSSSESVSQPLLFWSVCFLHTLFFFSL